MLMLEVLMLLKFLRPLCVAGNGTGFLRVDEEPRGQSARKRDL